MLILEGPQGAGKSTALRALFGDSWFTDTAVSLESKDAAMQLRGAWCWELGELAGLSRAEVNHIKNFLSSQVDRLRDPYGRHVESHPRQCVITGSTNEGEYLRDPTGARRFWPVVCGRIDLEALRRDRDQIWAEAVVRYNQNEQTWLTADEVRAAAEMAESKYEHDSWEDRVAAWIERGGDFGEGKYMTHLTIESVWTGAFGGSPVALRRPEQVRIAGILRRLGWVHSTVNFEGKRQRGFYRATSATDEKPQP
jgi:predicted P-loop ATPase